jgi:hypothetical protein
MHTASNFLQKVTIRIKIIAVVLAFATVTTGWETQCMAADDSGMLSNTVHHWPQNLAIQGDAGVGTAPGVSR